MPREQTWHFTNRWRLEAVLTTRTPLRIGSGDTRGDTAIHPEGKTVEVATVVLDQARKPCIPGSAVRGLLRTWCESHLADMPLIERLFGSDSSTGNSGAGGRAECWDCTYRDRPQHSGLPGWRLETGTAIEASVAIDRLTRTARDRKLFHREVVVPGTRFDLVVTGTNLGADEVAVLVAALHAFNDAEHPITLGAGTGSGKGRVGLETLMLQQIAPADLLAWLDGCADPAAMPTYRTLTAAEQGPILAAAKGLRGGVGGSGIALDLRIRIDGPFLVNDPPPKPRPEVPIADRPAAHRPRRDHAGSTLLPARSVRGVLRARAERIIRTLGSHACRVDDPRAACAAVTDVAGVERLCLACRAFGAPGWRSPLGVSDFALIEERAAALRQEFVAIDRFTGGGVEGLKFSAAAAIDPCFGGRLELDLSRGEFWMAGLLALVLRDLCEGDLSFGWGAAKGYGAAVGQIDGWRLWGRGRLSPEWSTAFPDSDALPDAGVGLTTAVQGALAAAVRAFRDQVAGVPT
jgi:CRISPR/Cas system CSM-associated protein Csm3 (group 7 of RAMP superfamily)